MGLLEARGVTTVGCTNKTPVFGIFGSAPEPPSPIMGRQPQAGTSLREGPRRAKVATWRAQRAHARLQLPCQLRQPPSPLHSKS